MQFDLQASIYLHRQNWPTWPAFAEKWSPLHWRAKFSLAHKNSK